jgi:hypothetical protein
MKYKYYILITIVLLIVATVLFLKDKPGTLKVDTHVFAVTDTVAITDITFKEGKNELVLHRSGREWMVNRNFHARPKAIKGLLNLLMNMEIDSPVPVSMKKDIHRSFEHKNISVTIESSAGIMKSYEITENDSLKVGSFVRLAGEEDSYLVRVVGYNGRISALFPFNPQFWRDKTIFSYRPADIVSLEVRYPGKPKASFAYHFLGPNRLEIKSLTENKSVNIPKDLARMYLLNYSSVNYERQVNSRAKEIMDSLQHQKPYCEIRVKNVINQEYMVRTYQIPVHGASGKFDIYKMYAVPQNDTVPLMVKFSDFDPIMKEYNDFVTP